MKRILVIGCPGSGKSTFARALRDKTGIPLTYLDRLYWNADRTTVDKAVFYQRLDAVLRQDTWIIDGNYASTLEKRLDACDTVFFLDYPTALCLEGIRQRRGQSREDMPWVEYEEDVEFIGFVKDFPTKTRPLVTALLEKYADKRLYIFKTRRQADDFLENIP